MENLMILLPLILLLASLASTTALTSDNPSFPSTQAKKMIRDFNLSPEREINIVEDDGGLRLSSVQQNSIVEKRFKFPKFTDPNGASVADLGHHAGYYQIKHSHAARMFYFFFESRGKNTDPVVIWLTGGPGCSGELALFYENGPFKIQNDSSLVWNEYGWDQVSNLLYVDQPTGTGFSYSTDERDIRHNEQGVSDDLYDFLQAFFKEHPELVNNDFFITGESFAGHYIPAFAARVVKGNKAKEGIHINLKGFAIGNGLTDPLVQYPAYTDYALEMGLIKESDYKDINKHLPLCETAIELCGTDGTEACMAACEACDAIFTSIKSIAGNINHYDIRKECVGSLCYDFSVLENFLDEKSVREALGVGDLDFVACSPVVNQALIVDWMRNLEPGIPLLLADGIRLLVYAGEYDLICNWLGNSRWVHAMEWSGKKEFGASPELPFEVDGFEVGLFKTHEPLTFLKIYDAGHMVPMDQPKAALSMLKRWMRGSLSETASQTHSVVDSDTNSFI
ncbi:serine carboxypeptidase-like isoform X1 [Lactuca sativa]|uniref:Carboxypeptidase n=2 Tax=Lactuca sativa TaxID=4236 RepID=A0A9R1XSJ9_LACSA|nr:serine carboxypeptidase-like isoform X1 [Lactuca sativa]KAJ0223929.1 hypothetical protein LSAT_V11C200091660 [Lactuca sativa]